MVQPSNNGLVVGTRWSSMQKPRWTIRCIHNAPEGFADLLQSLWASKGWKQAWHVLASADIVVTNTGDKRSQLLKVPTLSRSVQQIMFVLKLQRWVRRVLQRRHRKAPSLKLSA